MTTALKNVTIVEAPIAASASDSDYIDLSGAKSGSVYIPSGWTAANLIFLAKSNATAKPSLTNSDRTTGARMRSSAGALLKVSGIQTGEAGWYALPAAVFDAPWVALRSANTGTDAAENQGAARNVMLALTR